MAGMTKGTCNLSCAREKGKAMQLKVQLDEGAFLPERAHATDAGLDIRTRVNGYGSTGR